MRLSLAFLIALSTLVPAQIPSPEDVIGFKPGTDGRLANYDEILGYMRALARASDRVEFRVVGQTTEGRDFVSVLISAPQNIARVDQIRRDNLRLADPRDLSTTEADALIARGKTIILLNESIHSTEVGPAQAGMVTAHFLATTQDPKWLEVLANVVVVLTPCHNPDGYAAVVSWWRKYRDDPERRGVGLPVLYHKYVGHDNNRDWFMLTQAESRVTVVEGHMKWRPQIIIDQHQMGGSGARMFVPPYQEPYEPMMHPLLRKGLTNLGRSVLESMIEEGNTGVWCNKQFDAWTPARAFMHYHGGVRILTEVASARLADPIKRQRPPRGAASRKTEDNPAPWKGGRWGLDDIVRYTSRGALHAIRYGGEHRRQWLTDFLQIHRDQCDQKMGPAAYIIPSTGRRAMASKLLDILTLGGVEIDAFAEPVMVGERIIERGFLIKNGQPNYSYAAALLGNPAYPEIRTSPGGPIRRPYDMTCHSLPLLMDFEIVECATAPKLTRPRRLPATMSVRQARGLLPTLIDYPAVIASNDESALIDALRLAHQGFPMERTADGEFVIHGTRERPAALLWSPAVRPAQEADTTKTVKITPRKIGVYWSWTASMDEGWTRFWFDMFQIPFLPIRPEDVREGNLRAKVDVLLMASVNKRSLQSGPRDRRLPDQYRGGLGDAGGAALKDFVEGGGTLICMNDSAPFAIDLLDLPIEALVPTGAGPDGKPRRTYIPGSVVRARVDTDHPLGRGCNPTTPIFLRKARPFGLKTSDSQVTASFPVRYASKDLVAGGFAENAEVLHGKAAAAVCEIGEGRAVLFAFSPQFRCQTWSTFRLLLNALLL